MTPTRRCSDERRDSRRGHLPLRHRHGALNASPAWRRSRRRRLYRPTQHERPGGQHRRRRQTARGSTSSPRAASSPAHRTLPAAAAAASTASMSPPGACAGSPAPAPESGTRRASTGPRSHPTARWSSSAPIPQRSTRWAMGWTTAAHYQYYRYDDRDRSLVCVSCPPDGSRTEKRRLPEAARRACTDGRQHHAARRRRQLSPSRAPKRCSAADQNTARGRAGTRSAAADLYEWRDGRAAAGHRRPHQLA